MFIEADIKSYKKCILKIKNWNKNKNDFFN